MVNPKRIVKPDEIRPPTKAEIDKERARQEGIKAAQKVRAENQEKAKAEREKQKADKKSRMDAVTGEHAEILKKRDADRAKILAKAKKKAA